MNFFFATCLSEGLLRKLGPVKKIDDYGSLPKMNEAWIPVWFPANTFAINWYPPENPYLYKYAAGFADNTLLPSMHTDDTNDEYTVVGYWAYFAEGSGVRYSLGRSLRAKNKLHSLFLLGLNANDIAGMIRDTRYMINTGEPYKLTKDLANEKFEASTLQGRLAELAEANIGCVGKFDYDTDRVNNTADLDGLIAMLARSQGYDSVQFTVQANGNGGWAHEIVWVNFRDLVKQSESTWSGWSVVDEMATCPLVNVNGMQLCKNSPFLSCIPRTNPSAPVYLKK